MISEAALNKLEISKNLLQMNFMRRTLIAKEESGKPLKTEMLTPIVDSSFPLKSSIVQMLGKRQQVVSKSPVVRHLPGINGTAFPGIRASYGGFNPYLENLDNAHPVPSEAEVIPKKDVAQLQRAYKKCQPNRKRKRFEHPGPVAKKAKRKHLL
ncbi:hypothetical protein Aperf_G00000088629 [Anoplocephala perfoliata]